MADPEPARRPPSEYRPDLRPMLILGLVLLAVVAGWILLAPRILPAASSPGTTEELAGTWARDPDQPMRASLVLDDGTYELRGELDYTGRGTAVEYREELILSADPNCPVAVGRYEVSTGTHDRRGLLPQFTAQTLTLTLIEDACGRGQRAAGIGGEWVLRTTDREGVHGVCDPPNEEAAVTGHWPAPSGC
jgi:hypothetical protein